jgi:hypothetical protein
MHVYVARVCHRACVRMCVIEGEEQRTRKQIEGVCLCDSMLCVCTILFMDVSFDWANACVQLCMIIFVRPIVCGLV